MELSLADGLQAKRDGLALVEESDHKFIELMREAAIRISNIQGMVSSDDLRLYGCAHGIYPRHQNSYGAIFRGKRWREIGRKKSALPSSHAREIRVWKWEE